MLDPWNGSGTTTSVATKFGIRSTGVDINPALAVVAKARLAQKSNVNEVRRLLGNDRSKVSQKFLRETCAAAFSSRTRSLLLLAIFRIVRRKLRNQERVSTNPTWWNLSRDDVVRVVTSTTNAQLNSELMDMASKLTRRGPGPAASLIQADLLSLALPHLRADAIISSPPYLTRIDYVIQRDFLSLVGLR